MDMKFIAICLISLGLMGCGVPGSGFDAKSVSDLLTEAEVSPDVAPVPSGAGAPPEPVMEIPTPSGRGKTVLDVMGPRPNGAIRKPLPAPQDKPGTLPQPAPQPEPVTESESEGAANLVQHRPVETSKPSIQKPETEQEPAPAAEGEDQKPTPSPRPRFRVQDINWSSPGRPQAQGKPLPLSALPYWYAYPWMDVPHKVEWTRYLLEKISESRIFFEANPTDATRFCPRFSNLTEDEKKLFWLRFFSVLSEMESSFKPRTVVHDVKVGPNIYSSGLFQLSLESSQSRLFGCSMIQVQEDLLDPKKNIACTIRIFSHYLRKDGVIADHLNDKPMNAWRGGSRYWAPLRHPDLKTKAGENRLDSWVQQSRPKWIEQAQQDIHPARLDSDYRKKGEKMFQKLIRVMNMMPICR